MKNKKLLLIVLSTLLVLSLALFTACGGGKTSESGSNGESSTPTQSTPNESSPSQSSPTDEREVASISYESGLDAEFYLKNTDLDLSNLKIKVNYTDGSSAVIGYNDSFSVVYDSNVEQYGDYRTVTINYGGKSCEKEVIFYSQYKISSVAKPDYYVNYLKVVSAEKPIYTDVSAEYMVGDDNPFSVSPVVAGINNFYCFYC